MTAVTTSPAAYISATEPVPAQRLPFCLSGQILDVCGLRCEHLGQLAPLDSCFHVSQHPRLIEVAVASTVHYRALAQVEGSAHEEHALWQTLGQTDNVEYIK